MVQDTAITHESRPVARRKVLAAEIGRLGQWLCGLYALEFEFEAGDFLVSPELARRLLPARSPRTGVLSIQAADALHLAVYVDPRDHADLSILVEETSHLVCLSWHAAHDLPVSCLLLELQGEIDRFLYSCHRRGQLVLDQRPRLRAPKMLDWLDGETRGRYEIARERAHRYCEGLVRRFARRRDWSGLARELRRYYRTAPGAKLAH